MGSMVESQEVERDGQQGRPAGTGRAAQDTGRERGRRHKRVDRLGNGWARWDAARWGELRRRQGGIGWDAREWGRMLGNGMGH